MSGQILLFFSFSTERTTTMDSFFEQFWESKLSAHWKPIMNSTSFLGKFMDTDKPNKELYNFQIE